MDFYNESDSLEEKAAKEMKIDLPVSLVDDVYLQKLRSIPEKLSFKIGEVADILGVKQYVLRYWETEFEELSPKKSGNNQRIYSRKNVEAALMIQKLLHRDRYSIEGARKVLKNSKQEVRRENEYKQISKDLLHVRRSLRRILDDIHSIRELF
tara:strand:+ start:6029 stop:6487 length:459 start_codon:yes stop_codon:yes gene_type:complete